ncbi:MAG: Crp/Fnr family transcriptional regulator [Pyrinomonadaceae bacterium]|nr:Crp/Fnr family transcriptional regulator [Pyrinomonadaceae bacterium]MBP6211842.1 Crp/Fnr family transcriptional regulator [Pyrinomonadaceae bacterium]
MLKKPGKSRSPVDDSKADALRNNLLSALPKSEFGYIHPKLELVDLKMDDVLWEMEEKREYVYFPTTAMICLLYETEEGVSVEVGMTGSQGMVGVVAFVGDARMAKRAVVQSPGRAYRMKAKAVEAEFARNPAFQDICMCYTQTLIAQISQSAICNRLHTIQQQLCRYLLVNHDNLRTKTLQMTHEQISNVLGVRRESVSAAASELRDAGLIETSRGKIKLVDIRGLETTACECYTVVREQYDRILSKYLKSHRS